MPEIVKPTGPIGARVLSVECPWCGEEIEYAVADDDSATFGPEEDWPICEPCDVIVDVPRVRIEKVAPR